MEQKKKMGRPSQDKVRMSLTLDRKLAEFIDSLPDGDRSRFVNGILVQGVATEKLSGKFYNYFLMYQNGTVFYVGKGQGNRINEHEYEARRGVQSYKCNVIRKIWADGEEIIKQKVAFHDNEEDAYQLEILLINFFGRENLTNLTDGGEEASVIYGPRREYHFRLSEEVQEGHEMSLADAFDRVAARHGGDNAFINKILREHPEIIKRLKGQSNQ